MKRLILIFLSIIFCFSIISCGEKSKSEIPSGTEIGNILPSFDAYVFDENGLTGEKIDPTKTRKVTVINFWATWCGYCLDELPYFDRMAQEYKDSVEFVAIHSASSFSDDAINYVRSDYKDSEITFAKDSLNSYGGDVAYSLCGGKGYLPYTVIINQAGVITYKTSGQIPEILLEYEIENALG